MDITRGRLNPTRAERLLAGLMAMPDSLYRARMLEEAPESEDRGDGPLTLPWLGWDSRSMVVADMRNMMDALISAKYGGKDAKPNPMLPPGSARGGRPRENEGSAENFKRMFARFHMT